jgi:tyrosyl-tRNA synthetase
VLVDDAPVDMFGKVMSIPDDLMPQWFRLATELPEPEVSTIVAGLEDGSLHPGEAKRRLGREIVTLYHSKEASADAEAAFDRVFRHRQAPEDVPEHSLPENDIVHLPGVLHRAGLVASTSEARRLIAQGAVRIDGSPVSSGDLPRSELVGALVQVGKRRFVRLV